MANSHKVKGSKPKSRKSVLKFIKRMEENNKVLKSLENQRG